jgi:hypothetical protein
LNAASPAATVGNRGGSTEQVALSARPMSACRHSRRYALILYRQPVKYARLVCQSAHSAAVPRRSTSLSPGNVTRTASANVETNRTQLNHNATVDDDNPLDTMRLRVVEPNNTPSP